MTKKTRRTDVDEVETGHETPLRPPSGANGASSPSTIEAVAPSEIAAPPSVKPPMRRIIGMGPTSYQEEGSAPPRMGRDRVVGDHIVQIIEVEE